MNAPLPPGVRSRTAYGLTAAAAEGLFCLQVCEECGAAQYPPRDACVRCLSARLAFREVARGGVVLAETTIRMSGDPYFRARLPWRIGTVALECGPVMVAHLQADVVAGARVRMTLRLDRGGNAVAVAMPEGEAMRPEDRQVLEMSCDPRGRRVLVSDGDCPAGVAITRAMAAAGAATVFVGVADPEAAPGGSLSLDQHQVERNRRRDGQHETAPANVTIVHLDLSDPASVAAQVATLGDAIDIVIHVAEVPPAGGVLDADERAARAAMEGRYFSLLRLARGFGPALRTRGGAFVTLLSVQALMSWPESAASSAAEAACLSASTALRTELRRGGGRVLHVFAGPLDIEAYAALPPPKVAPAALAEAVVRALIDGVEDVYVGEVAQDLRARLAVQPKAVERELGG